ncbi:MAG: MFS transporter [Hyphomicrobiaceae bacterium]
MAETQVGEPSKHPNIWWISSGLGLYVLLMYGITYYAVTTAAPRIAAEFSVPVSTIFAMFSAALLGTALLAPRYGRWTDQLGAARILLAGALLRAVALALMALAPNILLFVLAFLIVQLLSQITEYDAAFSSAVEVAGEQARTAISNITLWGGLASTAFWPATSFLLDEVGWRTMMLIYAASMLAVCVPIAALLCTIPPRRRTDCDEADVSTRPSAVAPARWSDRRFILLSAAFACGGIAYSLPALMLPVLEGLGLGAMAVVAGMLFGPSQTAGRLFELLYGSKTHALQVAVIASTAVALSLMILLASDRAWMGLLFAVMFGAGGGVSYVVRGSVVLALYGTGQYASWLGRLGRVRLIVSAFAPFVLALVLDGYGARGVVAFCTVAALASLGFFVWLVRLRRG